ncbi:MAG TPA: hypothetical protein VIU40_04305, partial [Geobacteraceae bacterium]
MKVIVALASVALLLPGHALAASSYEECIQEERTLRTKEKDRCGGFSYLLNPSGCFVAQKALKAFENGPCPAIIAAGKNKPAPNPPSAQPTVPAPEPSP